MKYKFLEHTADAKFQAYGVSLEEAFKNAALAMFSIIVDTRKVNGKLEKRIHVDGADKKSLLYIFLEELLYLFDKDGFLLREVRDLKMKDNHIDATLIGDKIDGYEILGQVKAVTYNDMIVGKQKDKDEYLVQVVLDL